MPRLRTTSKESRSESAEPRVLALVGPTASGKSALAIEVAERIGAEIISVDSAAIYRGMDVGTGKPTLRERSRIVHHLIDVVEPSASVSVAEFQRLARSAIESACARRRVPLLVGGSGLYFRAVVDPLEFPATDPSTRREIELEAEEVGPATLYSKLRDLDPAAAGRIQPENTRRVIRALEVISITGRPYSSFRTGWEEYRSIYRLRVAGLTHPRDELDRRIDARVDAMVASGLVEEVESLVRSGLRESVTAVKALGYAQMLDYLDGLISLEEAVAEIKRRTRRFARRQLAWFKADPRVSWFESDTAGAAKYLEEE